MPDLLIRDALQSDRPAILALTLAAYEEYASILGPENWGIYRANIVETLQDPGPAEQIIAELEGEPAGAVLLYPLGIVFTSPAGEPYRLASPEVRLLAVPPPKRNRGIGKALMLECIRRAARSGSTDLSLHTADTMAVAQSMYMRMGFKHTPEMDLEPAPGIVIKAFRLDLASVRLD